MNNKYLKKQLQQIITFFVVVLLIITVILINSYSSHAKTTSLGDRELSWGSEGVDVEELQRRLKEMGFAPGRIDGIYTPRTAQAVKKFQESKDLLPTGIADFSTIKKLQAKPSHIVREDNLSHIPENSQDEIYLLARVINGEARGEPYEGQVAVAAVILNRVRHPSFPNTISDVIFQPGAFTAVSDGQIWLKPTPSSFKAAYDALNGWDPSNGALYYWNPEVATSTWIWSRSIHKRIGKHVFGI